MSYIEQKYYPFKAKDPKNWKRAEKKSSMTHAEFMKNDFFQAACSKANVPPSKRQVSKFRRGMGLAYKHKGSANAAE